MNEPKTTDVHSHSTEVVSAVDRRRPGRVEYCNPELIEMLRQAGRAHDGQEGLLAAAEFESADDDAMPPRIAYGFIAVISLLLWGLIGLGIRSLLG